MDQAREYLTHLLQDRFGLVSGTCGTAAAIILYYMMGKSQDAIQYSIDVNNESQILDNNIRTSHEVEDPDNLIEFFYDDVKTSHEALLRGKRVSNNGPMLGYRKDKEMVWVTYQEVYDQAQQLGSALLARGLQPSEETLIGIYSQNRVEWIVSEEAAAMYSMACVPLYDTLGVDACNYIINQTEMGVIICDNDTKVGALLMSAASTPSLKCIIVMDGVSNNNLQQAEKQHIQVVSFKDVLAEGAQNLKDPVPAKPDGLATVCYTSGTTGNPKGVMLTHTNLIGNTASSLKGLPFSITNDDVHISYLPMAHMFERICQVFTIQHGARIGFFGGDVKNLIQDMQDIKPTFFPTVPRLLNRIYDKVLQGVQGSRIKSFLFNMALNKKSEMLKKGIYTNSSIWDKLVFSKVQKLLGGRLRFALVGSAPLSGEVLNFARCAFGCYVMEGYGQTEATAGITLTPPQEWRVGHVGAPMSCNLIKLDDVPEMDYYAKDNKGEVCVKGTNVMRGYYKDPEKTRETIDADGWLHTGDVGMWTETGALKIIDRRKHIFKLAQGEYLAPEKIEGIYLRSPFVAQAFVDGDSLQTFPVGVIVPDPEILPGWAAKKGIHGNMAELCENKEIKKAILEDIVKHGKENGLKGFEQVKHIHLHPELFTVENDLLTPTFKSKRPQLRRYFQDQIKAMYQT